MCWYQQLLSGFLTNSTCLEYHNSINGDNERVPGAVHRSPEIYLTAKENLGNPQPEDRLMTVIVSNGVPCLQMRSEGSHGTSGRENYKGRSILRFFIGFYHNSVCKL